MAGELVYLDSSALVKLVVRERETAALRRFLAARDNRISSIVATVEVVRAARRFGEAAGRRATEVLAGVALLALDDAVVSRARSLEPAALRTMDAIHLASALSLVPDLGDFVVYDDRLEAAARDAGLLVARPS
ncbi:MAG TPA: type II toxin-antitoxin system VapC family toxin [Thermoanaerobaculia bacterium]|nr:type II toxin-antitoxin system VapC family toxin [Thermoanaerobaculia bacterium]